MSGRIVLDLGNNFSKERAQNKRKRIQLKHPRAEVYLLDEFIESLIQEKNFSELEDILTQTLNTNQLLLASTPVQEAIIHAHTYIQQEHLEKALRKTTYSPKLNQAKALVAFSKKDYLATLTNLTSIPAAQLHNKTRMPYVVALQQEGIDITKQDKERILKPLLETNTLARRVYNEENTKITLKNPYKTIRDVLSK